MGILLFAILLVIGAVICWRISSNMEGRGTFLFWAGIAFAVAAILIAVNKVPDILAEQDTRPYSDILEL